jgi:hypothetical protein
MNFGRGRRLFYFGAILLPGILCFASFAQKKGQIAHTPVSAPATIDRLSADGGAPPPPLPKKKPSALSA